jgi:monoamine oxidase
VLGPEVDASTREGMERALEVFLPGSKLIKFDLADWRTDPYSNGGAAGYKPGRLSQSHSYLSVPEGRLTFASADIAISNLVSMEGAIEMGRRAGAQAADMVVRNRMAQA